MQGSAGFFAPRGRSNSPEAAGGESRGSGRHSRASGRKSSAFGKLSRASDKKSRASGKNPRAFGKHSRSSGNLPWAPGTLPQPRGAAESVRRCLHGPSAVETRLVSWSSHRSKLVPPSSPWNGKARKPSTKPRHPPRHRALAGCGTSCKHKTHPASQGDAGINKSASHAAPSFNQGRRRSLLYRSHFAAPFIVMFLLFRIGV